MQMGKEAAKQSLFIDNMVLHIKKILKDFTKNSIRANEGAQSL